MRRSRLPNGISQDIHQDVLVNLCSSVQEVLHSPSVPREMYGPSKQTHHYRLLDADGLQGLRSAQPQHLCAGMDLGFKV